jgi:hypothetical protein
MGIEGLKTSRMLIDIKGEKVSEKFFKAVGKREIDINHDALVKYILLMYDPHSPLIELIDGYWSRKYEALELSGFKSKEGKFEKKVEDMVLGKNDSVNDLIIDWLIYLSKPQWTHMVYLCEALLRYTRQTMDVTFDAKTELYTQEKVKSTDIKAVSELMDKMAEVVKKWTTDGDETKEFMERLYYKTHKELLKIRPEQYAERLSTGDTLDSDNPYGNYKVEKLKFAGSKVPEIKKEAPVYNMGKAGRKKSSTTKSRTVRPKKKI